MKRRSPPRPEPEIFKSLEALCGRQGYANVLAYFGYRDNMIFYEDSLKGKDLNKMNSLNRLIRTEIMTLQGLMIKDQIDFSMPTPDATQFMIDETEALLRELHDAMLEEGRAEIFARIEGRDDLDSPWQATGHKMLREAIFYAAETAFAFQYRDFCRLKYQRDNGWLVANKGFNIDDAITVIDTCAKFPPEGFARLIRTFKRSEINNLSYLTPIAFTVQDIVDASKCDELIVRSLLDAFSTQNSPCNDRFIALGDFNLATARPLVSMGANKYALFDSNSLWMALYESPFHWLNADKKYHPQFIKNRGTFTEDVAFTCMSRVFKPERVFRNVVIKNKRGDVLGEIDVLAVYADRAIIIQAKSKKLTLEARKGNDGAIQNDFADGVQDAYNQAWQCARLLRGEDRFLYADDGSTLNIRSDFREIFPICLLAEHYPALAHQTQQLLKLGDESFVIGNPIVIDVFILDLMTEFLSTPLYFLVYAQRRSQYFPKISVNSDNAALGFHLSQNLWLDDEFDYVNIGDDFTQDMDAAFVNRREGFKLGDTPEGILTRFKGTFFEELMEFINECEDDRAIDLGAFLLSLREEAARYLAENIQRAVDQSHKDFQNHDFSLVSDKVGLTFHCSFRSQDDAVERVIAHATLRKYKQKADKWFAVARNALNSKPFQVAAVIDEPWHFDPILEEASKSLKEYNRVPSTRPLPHAGTKKIGRNERCPCGSSKKYKFCCGG